MSEENPGVQSESAAPVESAAVETPMAQAQPESQTNESSWYWSDNVPGQGPRPDYLPEKYKTVAEAAKARSELEKKLGGFTGAPEAYKFDHLGLDPDQLMVKNMAEVAADLNMSQEGLDKFIAKIVDSQKLEQEMTLEEKVKSLGNDGEQEMRKYQYYRDNYMKPEESELAADWIQGPEDLKLFNRLIDGVMNKPVPTNKSMYMQGHNDSKESLIKEMQDNKQRYDTDEAYRKDWRNRMSYIDERSKR